MRVQLHWSTTETATRTSAPQGETKRKRSQNQAGAKHGAANAGAARATQCGDVGAKPTLSVRQSARGKLQCKGLGTNPDTAACKARRCTGQLGKAAKGCPVASGREPKQLLGIAARHSGRSQENKASATTAARKQDAPWCNLPCRRSNAHLDAAAGRARTCNSHTVNASKGMGM